MKHFHCSGKNEKHTDELQNTNYAISVVMHTQSTLLNLHLRLTMNKMKTSSKIHATRTSLVAQ